MSDCATCGGGSAPSGDDWVAPSNPCETEEAAAAAEVVAVDAPACDSIKTAHINTGSPCLNDPCSPASAAVNVNETCGAQAVNALFDVLVQQVAVPPVDGAVNILLTDATRYWVGLPLVIGTVDSHFFAKVTTRDETTNLITVTRVAGNGDADDGEIIPACAPVTTGIPSAGKDFCLYDESTGDATEGDLLLFASGDGCSAPSKLPSSQGFLYHANSGSKSFVPTPANAGQYQLLVDGGGNPSFSALTNNVATPVWEFNDTQEDYTQAEIQAFPSIGDGHRVYDWTDPGDKIDGSSGHFLVARVIGEQTGDAVDQATIRVRIREIGSGSGGFRIADQTCPAGNGFDAQASIGVIIPAGYEFQLDILDEQNLEGSGNVLTVMFMGLNAPTLGTNMLTQTNDFSPPAVTIAATHDYSWAWTIAGSQITLTDNNADAPYTEVYNLATPVDVTKSFVIFEGNEAKDSTFARIQVVTSG